MEGWGVPAMNVVLMAIGTQGDIQPFLAVGLKLAAYGHRVRVATHEEHRPLVEACSLEFYPVGGDARALAEFAVKNRGVFPRGPGEIFKLRKQMRLYIFGQLGACTAPDPGNPSVPFKADALIANPISYAHVHLADALGLHLHILFAQPVTATGEFAHPQARFLHEQQRRLSPAAQRRLRGLLSAVNRATYRAIDCAMFTGYSDIISSFRRRELGVPSLWSTRNHNHIIPPGGHKPIPTSYCFSPSLLPRPGDWAPHVDVVGLCELKETLAGLKGEKAAGLVDSHPQGYEPPPELAAFLATGSAPVYIGFGSMTLDRPQATTAAVYAAVKEAGVRAVIAKGWGGLGDVSSPAPPSSVCVVGQVPHSWLFPRCAAVVHHGGAGTTHSGLAAGCPTMVLPFFGDQPFWGEACRRAGLGPAPLSIQKLTPQRLAAGLRFLMDPQVAARARRMGALMKAEPEGAQAAMDSFHRHFAKEHPELCRALPNGVHTGPTRLPTGGSPQAQSAPASAQPAAAAGPPQPAQPADGGAGPQQRNGFAVSAAEAASPRSPFSEPHRKAVSIREAPLRAGSAPAPDWPGEGGAGEEGAGGPGGAAGGEGRGERGALTKSRSAGEEYAKRSLDVARAAGWSEMRRSISERRSLEAGPGLAHSRRGSAVSRLGEGRASAGSIQLAPQQGSQRSLRAVSPALNGASGSEGGAGRGESLPEPEAGKWGAACAAGHPPGACLCMGPGQGGRLEPEGAYVVLKRCPWLTWWYESAVAWWTVLVVLPLLTTLPFSTSLNAGELPPPV